MTYDHHGELYDVFTHFYDEILHSLFNKDLETLTEETHAVSHDHSFL